MATKKRRNPARVAEEQNEVEIAALQRATITHVGMAALAVQDFCREGMRVLKRYDDFAALDDERRTKRLQLDTEAEVRKAKGDTFIEEVTATFRKALPQMLRTMGLDPDGKPLGQEDGPDAKVLSLVNPAPASGGAIEAVCAACGDTLFVGPSGFGALGDAGEDGRPRGICEECRGKARAAGQTVVRGAAPGADVNPGPALVDSVATQLMAESEEDDPLA